MGSRQRLAVLGVLVALLTMLGIPSYATPTTRVTGDEPQYLLSALSLGRDGDLDISDEIDAYDYRPFHPVLLDVQTAPDAAGHQFSPHDPGLAVLLALPMRLGGWVAAKAALAICAGILAVLTAWVATRRFGVPHGWAVATTGAFALSTPLGMYATQVYPEVPAALVVVAVVAVITGDDRGRRAVATVVGATALAWLSVKYVPVAAALVAVSLARERRAPRTALAVAGALAVHGAIFLLVHRGIYGGWTAYASGDHFADAGELSVVGVHPDYPGRARRLVGLLVDREFGLAAWAPAWLLLPPALGALARRRPPGALALAVPALTGWLVATFAAQTMHGWWWPGRQVVVIAPLLVIAIAAFLARWRPARPVLAVTGVLGVGSWLWTVVEAWGRRHTLVVDFMATANPWYRLWRHALPLGRAPQAGDDVLTVLWAAGLLALVVIGARSGAAARRAAAYRPSGSRPNWR